MKNFTIDEKTEILNALDNYIDTLDRARHGFADSGEFLPQIWKLKELRIKLILDFTPIKIKPNNQMVKWPCFLCGITFRPGVPEWAFLDTGQYDPICGNCFEKHLPGEFKKACDTNKAEYEKYSKAEVITGNNDNLPF